MANLPKVDGTRAPAEVMGATTSSCAQTQPLGRLPPVQSGQTIEDFAEFEGTTSFSRASTAGTHRYKLSLRNSKLRIWLEDCESKTQFEHAFESYVNLNNAVPFATASEYVDYFHALLNKPVEDGDEIPRAFKPTKGVAFRLEISMNIEVLAQTRVVTYSFELAPISVERIDVIDVMESRMKDLRDEMKTLKTGGSTAVVELQETVTNLEEELSCRRAEISNLQRKIRRVEAIPLTVQAKATSKIPGNVLCWSAEGNYSNGSDGIIRNVRPGTYQVTAVVNYVGTGESQYVQLLKRDKGLQVVYCCGIPDGWSSCVLANTASIVEGDELSVVCQPNLIGEYACYRTLTQVGNSS